MEETHSQELIMFYNVENLFPADLPPLHQSDPTNSGLWNWNEKRYENKLFKIAHVFELIKEDQGVLPMIVGLSEIQGQKVLDDLVLQEPLSNYGVVHYDSLDERGVDVALLYDKTKIQIVHSEPITYFFEKPASSDDSFDTTRDVLFCKVKYQEELINVFVFHLPSKREKDVNKPKRDYIVKNIREKIIEIIKNNEGAVLICGDFNENPDDESLKNLEYDDNFNKILINPYLDLYNNHVFSTFHFADGLLFDQIILSEDFFSPDFPLNYSEALVFSSEKLSSWDRKFQGRPFRTYAGSRYLGGYSDHYPVFVKLNKKIK